MAINVGLPLGECCARVGGFSAATAGGVPPTCRSASSPPTIAMPAAPETITSTV